MQCEIEAERLEALQIELLAIRGRRLQDHLELVIMLQAVRVLAIAAIGRPARRLDEGGAPWLRPERPKGRRRVKGAGTDLDIVRLQDHAALLRPEGLQSKDQGLET